MSKVLTVRLDPAVKARFAAYCASINRSPSAVIRAAVEAQVAQSNEAEPEPAARQVNEPEPAARQVNEVDTGPKLAVRLWLTTTERDAIDRHVEHAGGSRAGWIARAVRGALTREPQFGAEELQVLGASNRELLAIGRNLNQIARRLNEGQLQQQVTAGLVEGLSQRIDEHIESIRWVMQAGRDRWSLR